MPPLRLIVEETYFDDEEEDIDSLSISTRDDSVISRTKKERGESATTTSPDGYFPNRQPHPQRRTVRFETYSVVYLYEGVTKEERSLVWYSREEEAAFMTQELVLHSRKNSSGGGEDGAGVITHKRQGAPKPADIEISVFDQACLLGSMVVHGILLRAMLIGHELAKQI
jgi:hypothetical protein